MNIRNRSATLLLATLAASFIDASPATAQIVYADNFDIDSSLGYTITADADTNATFAFNYAPLGIPSAPNSVGGTTLGLKLEANNGDDTGATAALSLAPLGRSFAGDFTIRFDMWINANGPFPGGGIGSTQFVTAGVGTAGMTVHRSTSFADGTWFAVDGEGGSGIDYRIHFDTALQGAASGLYVAGTEDADNFYYTGAFPGEAPPLQQQNDFPQQQFGNVKPGAVGFVWRQVEIAKTGTRVTWLIDGLAIADVPAGSFSGDNFFIGYWDHFASISDNPALTFGLIDNLRVIQPVPEPGTCIFLAAGASAGLCFRRKRTAR
ncbi:MAG TPA: hypothetical protein VFV83_08690 [Chthoniobacteraceae bacterium]|nr:hypothetical protein [Chthoniobacteraceae bacterium]